MSAGSRCPRWPSKTASSTSNESAAAAQPPRDSVLTNPAIITSTE